MTALWVLLALLVLLVLLSLLRLGCALRYDRDGFTVYVKAAFLSFRVYPPAREKKQRAGTPEKGKKEEEEAPPRKKGGSLSTLLALLPDLTHAAGKLLRKIRIDRLEIHLIWGAKDPADAAIGYGRASAALGALWGLIAPNFKVKSRDLTCDVDFDLPSPAVTLRAAFTVTLGQLAAVAVPLLAKFLKARSNPPQREGHNLTKEA